MHKQQLKNNAIKKMQVVLHFWLKNHDRGPILTQGTTNYWLHENVRKQQQTQTLEPDKLIFWKIG